jgi:hypothetical protein
VSGSQAVRWASSSGYGFLQPVRPRDDGHGPVGRSALWALTDQTRSHLLEDVGERQCLKAALLPPRWISSRLLSFFVGWLPRLQGQWQQWCLAAHRGVLCSMATGSSNIWVASARGVFASVEEDYSVGWVRSQVCLFFSFFSLRL